VLEDESTVAIDQASFRNTRAGDDRLARLH
jgi:hypothetical protein